MKLWKMLVTCSSDWNVDCNKNSHYKGLNIILGALELIRTSSDNSKQETNIEKSKLTGWGKLLLLKNRSDVG